ncbi:hybrid sensor histidine kinase/response regulator [Adlercreutzia sp. ZJ141]|uniref:hybrid sensor histidine kinase/response regulator n=1 Tax=Adlercreutzia sp. ZJ141 TaxID=2709406 RepID=UPI0013EAED36|nr:hybrid sensor histidine kinase/response regulator [Adlercreutzia sp. ZJ141]
MNKLAAVSLKNTTNQRLLLSAFILAAAIIAILTAAFVYHTTEEVESNALRNAQELADHDIDFFQSQLDARWDELASIGSEFALYHDTTMADVQSRLAIEQQASSFNTLYLVDDAGNLYSTTMLAKTASDNPYIAQLALGLDRSALRYDTDELIDDNIGGDPVPTIVYTVRINPYDVEETSIVGIIGLRHVDLVQEHLRIECYNGQGSSTVVDNHGDYVVNIDTDASDTEANFFGLLASARSVEDGVDSVIERIQANKAFTFSWVNADGKKMVSIVRPINNTDWQTVMAIPEAVFSEQSMRVITMTTIVLVSIVGVVVVLAALVFRVSRSAVKAEADAQARSEFLSNMSHEIRTPLNGLVGLNYLMRENLEDDRKMRDYLTKSSTITQYLLSLVNDILDVSKLQAGKFDIAHDPINLSVLIDAVYAMQRDTFANKGVSLSVSKQLTSECILSDETHVKQVLMNILSNAAKFTDKGGAVALRVSQSEPADGMVTTTFEVEDNGCGMDPEFMEHIFDPFAQERNKIKTSQKGTGLGMSISSLLVKQMGGTISVRSKRNVGSCFTVVLPAPISDKRPCNEPPLGKPAAQTCDGKTCDQAGAAVDGGAGGTGDKVDSGAGRTSNKVGGAASGTSETSSEAGRKRPTHILVAEDNELNATILTEILRGVGYSVECAADGQEAVHMVEESPIGYFELVLMDVQMPIMNGYDATRAIRKLDRDDTDDMVIFACTANTFKEDRDLAIEAGMNGFLGKPVNVEEMIRKFSTL